MRTLGQITSTVLPAGVLAFVLAAGGATVPAGAKNAGKIVVFAAASLAEAFNAAAPAFTRKTGIAVTFNYGGSDMLATQIQQGAPADVFASANEAQMKSVADAGLLAAPAKTFTKNRLVVISPKNGAVEVSGPADLSKAGVRVVLAAASVPVGAYARATFAKLAGHSGYPVGFAAAVEKNVISNELDVKAVVTKISLGEGDAGVVYSTDVTPAVAPKLTIASFPPWAVPDVTYPIAAIKSAQNTSNAKAFVDFVLSAEGQSFLKARGFLAP